MQDEIIPRRVDFDEAIEVSNWAGIRLDLQFVCEACDRLLDTDEEDSVMRRALFVAAVIAYARCFKGNAGVRVGLEENALEGLGDVLGLHRWYIALRNTHLAHSVSPFEQTVVGVAELDNNELAVVDLTQHLIGVPDQSIRELKAMATFLIDAAAKHAAQADAIIRYRYKGLTPAQVRALPLIELAPPTPNEAGEAREGLKRRQRNRRRRDQPPGQST